MTIYKIKIIHTKKWKKNLKSPELRCFLKLMQQIFFMMANKIYCLGKLRLHQILEFEICSFLNLLSDWSIQKFWKKSFLNFWINQSEKREGKFKIEKWSNFGPRYCEIGTKIGTSNIRIVIHMVKSVSERLNRKIGDGATGPNGMRMLLLLIIIFLGR